MEVRLQKWGNSDGIRIPSSYLKSLNLRTNDKVELIQEPDRIIILKPRKTHLTFEERVMLCENQANSNNVEQYDWGEDLGKEILD